VPVKNVFVLLCVFNSLDSLLIKISYCNSGILSNIISIKIPFTGSHGKSEERGMEG
jgi:hypothetical protein